MVRIVHNDPQEEDELNHQVQEEKSFESLVSWKYVESSYI